MSKDFISVFFKNFLFALAYVLGMLMLFMVAMHTLNHEQLFTRNNLLNWDGSHYNYIAHVQYTGFRNTFFPLFPFAWKAFGLGVYGIVFFNAFLFILSASLLATSFAFKKKEFLLMLSFPSLIFMFLPYSESLFFLTSSLVLMGMRKKNDALICIGLFLASITRSVGCIFIPALLILLMFTPNARADAKKNAMYIFSSLLGLLVVVLIQHACTGDWIAFYHAQNQWGGNAIKIPKLVISSWGGDNIVCLDSAAFFIGVLVTVVLLYFMKNKFFNNEPVKEDTAALFSMLYLAGICWFVLFTRGGSLFSLNRFVFATPFFFIGFTQFLKKSRTIKQCLLVFFLMNVFWIFFGNFVHIQALLRYLGLSLFLLSFFLISHPVKNISRISFLICMAGNVFLQLFFYYKFLDGCWVG